MSSPRSRSPPLRQSVKTLLEQRAYAVNGICVQFDLDVRLDQTSICLTEAQAAKLKSHISAQSFSESILQMCW
jgi:hypothetical protein